MFLRSLYEFAQTARTPWADAMPEKKHLADSPEFEQKPIHWFVCLDATGRFQGFESVTGVDKFTVPRTLEPKDSGQVAEFLVEKFETVMALGESATAKLKPDAKAKHDHFWSRIQRAASETKLPELAAALAFRKTWPRDALPPGVVFAAHKAPKSREAKEQWMVQTASGSKPLREKPTMSINCSFKVGDNILLQSPEILKWWSESFAQWLEQKCRECIKDHGGTGICVVSDKVGVAISDSHLPKIYGIPKTPAFGATLVSSESPSFHSYGLSGKKSDASYSSISVEAAITYGSALNYLLENKDYRIKSGRFAFCFWAKRQSLGFIARLLMKPQPAEVRKFRLAPFFPALRREMTGNALNQFYSVALTGNSGRAVVWHWLQQSLTDTDSHLKRWFEDLDLAVIPHLPAEERPFASIDDLCHATVRDPKDSTNPRDPNALIADLPGHLYRGAVEGSEAPLALALIKRVLRRLEADLAKFGQCILETHLSKDLHPQLDAETRKKFREAKQPEPPSGQARFALLKLILNRNRKETDMKIEPQLVADTDDVAYNCGRLLALFDDLQESAHKRRDNAGRIISELEGPGIVERYFGTASAAPNSAFPILWRLHVHLLRKLSQQGPKGRLAAAGIEKRITSVCARLRQTEAMRQKLQAPSFPHVLDLQRQGRFALGFYQQKAQRQADIDEYLRKKKAGELPPEQRDDEVELFEPEN
ncbi:MAG: type I-C CRISPR-associated protein Cas8c/Csd1 [Verrucomicrobiales bacterium]